MNTKVIGQKRIKDTFSRLLLKDKLGHAYILSGPVGIGKKTLARELAQAMLCDNSVSKPCYGCKSCNMFYDNSHPEFTVISTEKSKIGVDSIRDALRILHIKPLYSERKVILIEDGDRMTPGAQNALLKSIEEPPPYMCIIITVSNYEKLLSTIKSRAVRFFMDNYSKDEIRKAFSEKSAVYKDYYSGISGLNIGAALKMADNELLSEIRDSLFDKMTTLIKNGSEETMDFIYYLAEQQEDIDYIIELMISFFRDILVYKSAKKNSALINPDKKDMIIKVADYINNKKLIDNIDICSEARQDFLKNANFQITVDWLTMNLV
jgi:DNA polymerase-3 subunit delta'